MFLGDRYRGKNWVDDIEKALSESQAFVILVRSGGDPDEQLRLEWRKAAKHSARRPEAKIVPVMLGGAQPAMFLRAWNAVEMTDDIDEITRAAQKVMRILEAPGANETSTDSPEMRPLVEEWRRRLQDIEREAVAREPERVE